MMIICVKIARTCLLKRKNKNNKIQNTKYKYKIQIQNTKYKIQNTKYNKKQCPSKDIVFYVLYVNTHHRPDYIIG